MNLDRDVAGVNNCAVAGVDLTPVLPRIHGCFTLEEISDLAVLVDAATASFGVGALIQRGGRAVAGMLTIATAGGS